jgi:hypothetical protein
MTHPNPRLGTAGFPTLGLPAIDAADAGAIPVLDVGVRDV